MSTFGRGVRLELKRIGPTVAGAGFSTVLSVPSSSNYFIFINKIEESACNVRIARQVIGTSAPYTNFTTSNETINVNNSEPFIDYLSGVQDLNQTGVNATDVLDVTFHERLMKPNDALQISGNGVNSNYVVWYTEVYFGGQANY